MQTIEERFWEVDWHQGDIVDSGQTNNLLNASIDKRPSTIKDCVLCVISQDCDIVASADKEPYIELLAGIINPTICRKFADLKSPRIIDIPLDSQYMIALEFSKNHSVMQRNLKISSSMKKEGIL